MLLPAGFPLPVFTNACSSEQPNYLMVSPPLRRMTPSAAKTHVRG